MANPAESFIRPNQLWLDLGLRANQIVVHLGCGAGFYIIPAAIFVGKKGHVFGVDVRQDMLEEVEGRARREGVEDVITTIRADLEQGPVKEIKSDSADWTLVANVLYQSDPSQILTEAKRIAKPDGYIVIVEWDAIATPLGPPPEQRISRADIAKILTPLDLAVAEEFSPSPYHYGLLIKVSS